jgi:hypothetical protein
MLISDVKLVLRRPTKIFVRGFNILRKFSACPLFGKYPMGAHVQACMPLEVYVKSMKAPTSITLLDQNLSHINKGERWDCDIDPRLLPLALSVRTLPCQPPLHVETSGWLRDVTRMLLRFGLSRAPRLHRITRLGVALLAAISGVACELRQMHDLPV